MVVGLFIVTVIIFDKLFKFTTSHIFALSGTVKGFDAKVNTITSGFIVEPPVLATQVASFLTYSIPSIGASEIPPDST